MTEYRITDLKYENKNSYTRIYINEKKLLRKGENARNGIYKTGKTQKQLQEF